MVPAVFFVPSIRRPSQLCCFCVTAALQALSKACSEACKNVDNVTAGFMVATVLEGLVGIAKKTKEFIAAEPCFVVVIFLWLVHGFVGVFVSSGFFVPLSFAEIPTSTSTDTYTYYTGIEYSTSLIIEDEVSLEVTKTTWALVIPNAALAIGLLMKVLSSFEPRHAAPVIGSAQEHTSDSNVRQTCFGCSARSCVVEALGYVTILCFAVVGIFMMADTDVLGATAVSYTHLTLPTKA